MARSSVPNGKTRKQAASTTLTTPQVALYMRVSSEDQAEQGTIEAQRDFLRKFANLYQLPVADEYADDGVSGTLLLVDRPEGQRLLQDVEAGRVGVVLVSRMNRLGRSLKSLLDAHDLLSKFGVTIRSATEPFDTSTSIGNFFFQLLGSLAELDRKQVLEQLARGRDRVVHNGKWTDGPIPYGYRVDSEGCLTPSDRQVEALQMTEAEVVKTLFHRIATGSSAIIEAKRLTALGVPTTRYYSNGASRAGSKWYPGSVINILNNPTYKGTHIFNSSYGAIERTVPPLVDADVWERAIAQITRNKHLPKANATRIYLLRGLITCGQCGSAYVGQTVRNRNGAPSAFYRCCGRTPHWYASRERCTSKVVQMAWIETLIWEDCREYIRNPGKALAEAQRQLHDRMHQVAHVDEQRGEYMKALAEKTQERDRVINMHRRGVITFQDAEAHLAEIAREEADLRRECSAIDAQRALVDAYETQLTDASLMLHRLQENVDTIERTDDRTKKQEVIELLVQSIRIDTHADRTLKATIRYRFSPARVASSSTLSSDETCYTLTRVVSPPH